MPVDSRPTGRDGADDDWLGGIGEIDWNEGARPPGASAQGASSWPSSREDVTAELHEPERNPEEAKFRRRRAIGLVVALAALGGVIWLAVAAFGGGGSASEAEQTTTAITTQPATPPAATPTTPTTTTPPATNPNPLTVTLGTDELLKQGATGQTVTDLQTGLKAVGFDPGSVDGTFGPLTEAAVTQFQQANNLKVDGIVGPQTVAALNSALAALPASSTG